jgi:hypothetical protein
MDGLQRVGATDCNLLIDALQIVDVATAAAVTEN